MEERERERTDWKGGREVEKGLEGKGGMENDGRER